MALIGRPCGRLAEAPAATRYNSPVPPQPLTAAPLNPRRDAPRAARSATLVALAAALRGRCPRCGAGRLFRGPLALAWACDACGLRFDDDGSAITAGMVFGFGVPILAALPLGFALIVREAHLAVVLGAPIALLALASAPIMRLTKAVWVWGMASLGYLHAPDAPVAPDAPDASKR